MGAERYHSTENPYEIVEGVQGHDDLRSIATVARDLMIRDGQPYVYDYTVRETIPITSDVWLVRDPRGLRLVSKATFKTLFGKALSYEEVQRWSNATPGTEFVSEPKTPGKVHIKNDRTVTFSVSACGDTDEEMTADAICQGREAFGHDAELEIYLSTVRVRNYENASRKHGKWSSVASITRR